MNEACRRVSCLEIQASRILWIAWGVEGMPDSVVCVGGTGGSELGDDILWWKDFGREREEEERRGSTQERKSILDTHVVWVLREPLVQTDMQVACYTIQKEEKK